MDCMIHIMFNHDSSLLENDVHFQGESNDFSPPSQKSSLMSLTNFPVIEKCFVNM